MSERPNGLTYAQAGVSIDAGNELVERIKPLARSTRRAGSEPSLGGFGALFDLKAAGYDDPLLVTTTDGVGTKLKVAIETGIHDTVGIDLVAMCVNDLLAQGAEPLMFLDYFATGKLDVEAAATVVAGIAEGCRQAGCALVGGETAEMPGMYADGDYDMAGFCVGAVDRDKVLPRMADQKVGDILIRLGAAARLRVAAGGGRGFRPRDAAHLQLRRRPDADRRSARPARRAGGPGPRRRGRLRDRRTGRRRMRRCLFLLAGVALLAGGAAAQNVKSPQAAGYTQLFMSPCGEPYRGRVGDPYP